MSTILFAFSLITHNILLNIVSSNPWTCEYESINACREEAIKLWGRFLWVFWLHNRLSFPVDTSTVFLNVAWHCRFLVFLLFPGTCVSAVCLVCSFFFFLVKLFYILSSVFFFFINDAYLPVILYYTSLWFMHLLILMSFISTTTMNYNKYIFFLNTVITSDEWFQWNVWNIGFSYSGGIVFVCTYNTIQLSPF